MANPTKNRLHAALPDNGPRYHLTQDTASVLLKIIDDEFRRPQPPEDEKMLDELYKKLQNFVNRGVCE